MVRKTDSAGGDKEPADYGDGNRTFDRTIPSMLGYLLIFFSQFLQFLVHQLETVRRIDI